MISFSRIGRKLILILDNLSYFHWRVLVAICTPWLLFYRQRIVFVLTSPFFKVFTFLVEIAQLMLFNPFCSAAKAIGTSVSATCSLLFKKSKRSIGLNVRLLMSFKLLISIWFDRTWLHLTRVASHAHDFLYLFFR